MSSWEAQHGLCSSGGLLITFASVHFSLFRLEVKWNLCLSFANLLSAVVEDWYPDEFEVTIASIPCLASCVFLIITHNTIPLIPAQRRQASPPKVDLLFRISEAVTA